MVPLLPGLAICIDWALLVQLSPTGLMLISAWLLLALGSYFAYGYRNSLSHQFAESDPQNDLVTSSFCSETSLDTGLYRAPVRYEDGLLYVQKKGRENHSRSFGSLEMLNILKESESKGSDYKTFSDDSPPMITRQTTV